jgi:hypothetical protein
MPNTINNNWPTPADTDLVKNGADAIRDLGNAIDTTLGVYNAAGLVKISATTFSASSGVSFAANTFSSTYANYRIILSNLTASTGASIYMRLRASGTDNTSNIYYQQQLYLSSSTVSGVRQQNTFWSVGSADTSTSNFTIIDLFNPQTTAKTRGSVLWNQSGITTPETLIQTMTHDSTTQFDSATLYPNTGTISGTVYVYGYSN